METVVAEESVGGEETVLTEESVQPRNLQTEESGVIAGVGYIFIIFH